MNDAVALLRDTKDYPAQRISLGSPLYNVVSALGDQEAATGDIHRALEIYEGLLREVLASNPKSETNLQDAARWSHGQIALAGLYRRAGKTGLASTLEASQLALWRRWDVRLPNNSFVRRQLVAASVTVP
jgi:hypothetical protein